MCDGTASDRLRRPSHRIQRTRLFAQLALRFEIDELPTRFVWIGDGDPTQEARLRAAGVEVTGHIANNEVAEVLGRATVYLQTSVWEGMPVSLMSAMAAGLPCVVADVASHRDVVIHGKSGFIVRDIDDFDRHVRWLIDEPERAPAARRRGAARVPATFRGRAFPCRAPAPVWHAARNAQRADADRGMKPVDHLFGNATPAVPQGPLLPELRVAVVHDWLVSYAGAERVTAEILRLFPQADLFSVVDFRTPEGRACWTTGARRRPSSSGFPARAPVSQLPAADAARDRAARPRAYDLVLSRARTRSPRA